MEYKWREFKRMWSINRGGGEGEARVVATVCAGAARVIF